MPKAPRTVTRRRTRPARNAGRPRAAMPTCATPLLQLQAHWTMQAHPRYLEAATFLWQR